MWNREYIIIGDRFDGFCAAAPDSVHSESAIVDKIVTEGLPNHPVHLIIEQGVDLTNIAAVLRNRDPKCELFTIVHTRHFPRAVRRLAHKNNSENILVSYPVQVGPQRYSLEMLLDRSGEFFLDHMSGCHIQGMALIEAARQSFLAVTEEFYLREAANSYYFVIKNFNSKFLSFAFPLRTIIDYQVHSYRPKEGRHSFDITVRLLQSDEVCAEFEIGFTAFLSSVIAEREAEKASQAVGRVIAASPSRVLTNESLVPAAE